MAIYSVKKDGTGDSTTIAGALALATSAGDIVEIQDSASYQEDLLDINYAITVRAQPGQSPTMDGQSSTNPCFRCYADGIVIDGLEFIGYNGGNVIYVNTVQATISNCTFTDTTSTAIYGLYSASSSNRALITGCKVVRGSNLCVSAQGFIDVVNCTVYASQGNKAVYIGGSYGRLRHCTIVVDYGGVSDAIFIGNGSATNCIAYNLTSIGEAFSGYGNHGVYNCCYYGFTSRGSTVGSGDVNADPLLLDLSSSNPDLRIQGNSPCIDAGTTLSGISTDIDGNPRVVGNAPDIGAYEFQGWTYLKGYYFAPGMTVKFGGTPAVVTLVDSSTSARVQPPSGSGTVDVTVTVNGRSYTKKDGYTYP